MSVVCSTFGVERSALFQRTHNNILRSMAAKCLCKWSGCTQREVGELLEIGNCSSVSHRLKQLHELLTTDNQLEGLYSEIEHILNEKHNVKV